MVYWQVEFQHDHSLASLGAKPRGTKMVSNCYCLLPFVQETMALFRGIYTMFLVSCFFSSASFGRQFWRKTNPKRAKIFQKPLSQFYSKTNPRPIASQDSQSTLPFREHSRSPVFFFHVFWKSWFKSSRQEFGWNTLPQLGMLYHPRKNFNPTWGDN